MYIAPHWARARCDLDGQPSPDGPIVAFGWSFQSEGAAQLHALARAMNLADRISYTRSLGPDQASRTAPRAVAAWMEMTPLEVRGHIDGRVGSLPDDYYGVIGRPVREPILARWGHAADPWALITRNRYGARVLNTATALFFDVDLPAPPVDHRSMWQRLRGVAAARAASPDEVEARIRAIAAGLPGLGLRLYRTRNGFRGLVTSRPYKPGGEEAEALMEAFGTDPLYLTLCRTQHCFRARLTPKPWRIGLPSPPHNWYPYPDDPSAVAAMKSWIDHYERVGAAFAACTLVATLGAPEVHPEVAPVVELHDQQAMRPGELA